MQPSAAQINQAIGADSTDIDLPLVKITKSEVLGALFVHAENEGEQYRDALLKLQTWVINFAEEQIRPLHESHRFSDEELDAIRKKVCVISPITLTLYLHWLQMEQFAKMPDSEKERYLLEKIPDRFKARYKGNAACRNAREVTAEEEITEGIKNEEEEDNAKRKGISFAEFLNDFGAVVRNEIDGGRKDNGGK